MKTSAVRPLSKSRELMKPLSEWVEPVMRKWRKATTGIKSRRTGTTTASIRPRWFFHLILTPVKNLFRANVKIEPFWEMWMWISRKEGKEELLSTKVMIQMFWVPVSAKSIVWIGICKLPCLKCSKITWKNSLSNKKLPLKPNNNANSNLYKNKNKYNNNSNSSNNSSNNSNSSNSNSRSKNDLKHLKNWKDNLNQMERTVTNCQMITLRTSSLKLNRIRIQKTSSLLLWTKLIAQFEREWETENNNNRKNLEKEKTY